MMIKKINLTKRINNLPLGTKIVLIILTVLVFNLSASLAGIIMVLNSSNKLLYNALETSLSYTAEDISSKLSNIESMSGVILSSQNVRKTLISLSDEISSVGVYNADNTLRSLLSDYYQTYKDNNISYLNLYNPLFTSYSFESKSNTTPIEVQKEVIQAAHHNSGYPCWITDYSNSYGLFLGRDSIRVNNMEFDTLGTLVVSIDLEKMIKSSTQSLLNTDSAQYIIYDGSNEIFHSKTLDASYVDTINQSLNQSYDILTISDHKYFCVRGSIPNPNWDYICLIPYDHISNTLVLSRVLSISVIMLTVITSLLFSRLLIKSITKDFHLLVAKMDAFGKDESKLPSVGGNYTIRKDEIGMLHNQFDQMAIKLQQLIQENYINEILTKDAKLKALENQINPHFLYNTLESVNWRAKAIGEKNISLMVESLGTLLRATLSNKNAGHTIADELAIVRCYMNIQQIRFEDRLNYSEEIDEHALTVLIPQLVLQPLAENAINYSLEEILETCHVLVRVTIHDSTIFICVINNGSQFEDNLLEKLSTEQVLPHGFGIGLLNIHQRLQLIYGSTYGLTLYNQDEDTAVAQITIPLMKEEV